MPTIDDLFLAHTARSLGYESYEPRNAAFVTNGLENSGVLGFVTPKSGDKVFDFVGIAISAFLEATVQAPPFVARGNGGSGLIVLEPKQEMSAAQLGHVSAYINSALRWRFSWYRQATVRRIKYLDIPHLEEATGAFRISPLLPLCKDGDDSVTSDLTYEPFKIESLYALHPGDYHCLTDLQCGSTPIISCGTMNNGIAGFVKVPSERMYSDRLTIAFNGSTLAAKYHPYAFAAKDDVAVCFPKSRLRVSTELFIQVMLGREQWRFSYYRKCYRRKLEKTTVLLPAKNGQIDEDAIYAAITATPYWPFLKNRVAKSKVH